MTTYRLEKGWYLATGDRSGSDGNPVLLHGNRAYAPFEFEGGPANRVAAWAYVLLRTRGEDGVRPQLDAAQAYLAQWPDGPRVEPEELSELREEASERR